MPAGGGFWKSHPGEKLQLSTICFIQTAKLPHLFPHGYSPGLETGRMCYENDRNKVALEEEERSGSERGGAHLNAINCTVNLH